MEKTSFKQKIFIAIGVLCVVFGVVGIVLPILPTTPFFLLASYLFLNSSKRLNDRLLNSKVFGESIKNYQMYRAVKRRTKIASVVFLWTTLGISIYLVNNIWIRLMLIGIGIAVSIHIIALKTLEK